MVRLPPNLFANREPGHLGPRGLRLRVEGLGREHQAQRPELQGS